MQFDAREVKLLPEGAVLLFDGYPGLRMSVSKNKRAWIYRYKSPVDGRMRQCRIGVWPAMSHLKAAVEWEALRALRNSGQDPVLMKRKIKADSKQEVAKQNEEKRIASFTIKQLCDLYLEGHIKPVRTPKGYDYVKSLFQCHLADINSVPVRDIMGVIQSADKQEVGDLFQDLHRVGDTTRPEGIPYGVYLAAKFAGKHAESLFLLCRQSKAGGEIQGLILSER